MTPPRTSDIERVEVGLTTPDALKLLKLKGVGITTPEVAEIVGRDNHVLFTMTVPGWGVLSTKIFADDQRRWQFTAGERR